MNVSVDTGRRPVDLATVGTEPAVPARTLNDGNRIPAIGFGTSGLKGPTGASAITSALRQGYRLVDSAAMYGNEGAVGEAIRRSGVPRADLFVTSKLQGANHPYEAAVQAAHESVWRMGLDYLDLFLIHWPNPRQDRYVEAWQALVDLQREGLIRSIGVSNFLPEHLDRIIAATGVTPAVNQIELNPYWPQPGQRQANVDRGILSEAWSPGGRRSGVRDDPAIIAIAQEHGRTPNQIILRWHIQNGVVPIPKSADPGRQAENLAVFDFNLSDAELVALASLGRVDGRAPGSDPREREG